MRKRKPLVEGDTIKIRTGDAKAGDVVFVEIRVQRGDVIHAQYETYEVIAPITMTHLLNKLLDDSGYFPEPEDQS